MVSKWDVVKIVVLIGFIVTVYSVIGLFFTILLAAFIGVVILILEADRTYRRQKHRTGEYSG